MKAKSYNKFFDSYQDNVFKGYTLDGSIEQTRTITLDKFVNPCTHLYEVIATSGRCQTKECLKCGQLISSCD